jgi:hypothetical protein
MVERINYYGYFGVRKRQLSPAEADASALHIKSKNLIRLVTKGTKK